MPVVSTSIGSIEATLEASQTPTIYNITATLADTEYSQALSSGTKKLTVRVRGLANMRIAYANGGTSTAWVTVRAGCVYTEDNLRLTSGTIYFQSDVAGQVVEILEWA